MVEAYMGDNPFLLIIRPKDNSGGVGVDLDEPGWATKYAEYMRVPARWSLMHKESGNVLLVVIVHEGDQPYYTARHVGKTGSGGSNEITAYGIGKKKPDGTVDRLWVLPGGVVVAGDDVDEVGVELVEALGPR